MLKLGLKIGLQFVLNEIFLKTDPHGFNVVMVYNQPNNI